jgi:hypothetical protein
MRVDGGEINGCGAADVKAGALKRIENERLRCKTRSSYFPVGRSRGSASDLRIWLVARGGNAAAGL